jgi:hypothetical protein
MPRDDSEDTPDREERARLTPTDSVRATLLPSNASLTPLEAD